MKLTSADNRLPRVLVAAARWSSTHFLGPLGTHKEARRYSLFMASCCSGGLYHTHQMVQKYGRRWSPARLIEIDRTSFWSSELVWMQAIIHTPGKPKGAHLRVKNRFSFTAIWARNPTLCRTAESENEQLPIRVSTSPSLLTPVVSALLVRQPSPITNQLGGGVPFCVRPSGISCCNIRTCLSR